MEEGSILGSVIAFFIVLASWKGLRDQVFFDRYKFEVDAILIDREYNRIFTSGFLHGGWWHLAFNLVALVSFAAFVEREMGPVAFLVVYFGSLLGGNLLSLFFHRNHGDYSAIGASGAVSGIVFSSIVLDPNGSISFFLIDELSMRSWIFGLLFIVVSIFGIKRQADNIGHDAHLGGAIIGLLLTVAFRPNLLSEHPWLIAALLLPAVLFLILVVRNPAVLLIENYWGEQVRNFKSRVDADSRKRDLSPQEELDELLDKIRRKGIDSLSDKERKRLEQLSK